MNSEEYDAEIAAEMDAKSDVNKIIWICAGVFGNVIGILVAYIHQPTPPLSRLYKKSDEYQMLYTDTYKAKTQKEQLIFSVIGCLILISVNILLFGFAMFSFFLAYRLDTI